MDLNQLMAQAQAMQKSLTDTKEKLEQMIYEGKSNGIVVKMNGKCEVQELTIPDELMDDKEMLQDMILVAFNNAVEAVEKDRDDKIGAVTQGFNIPGM